MDREHRKPHTSITRERVLELLNEGEYIGLCVACGAERECTEPDARRYECPECNSRSVYGVEELLLMTTPPVPMDEDEPGDGFHLGDLDE